MYPYLLSLALILEVSAYPKPGNIHRFYLNSNNLYERFLASSHLSIKWFIKSYKRGLRGWGKVIIGDLIYYSCKDIVKYIGRNDHLGAFTLLIPLSVNIGYCVRKGLERIDCFTNIGELLESTTVYDSVFFYRAIRITKPSHLKPLETSEYVDVWSRRYVRELFEKNHRLIDVFKYSSSVEIVHNELLSNYTRSLDALNELERCLSRTSSWNECIVYIYIYLLSKYIDTLVVRKHSLETAEYVAKRASVILGEFGSGNWFRDLGALDRELKAKSINPGSIADIVASTIGLYLVERYAEREYLLIPS